MAGSMCSVDSICWSKSISVALVQFNTRCLLVTPWRLPAKRCRLLLLTNR